RAGLPTNHCAGALGVPLRGSSVRIRLPGDETLTGASTEREPSMARKIALGVLVLAAIGLAVLLAVGGSKFFSIDSDDQPGDDALADADSSAGSVGFRD